MNKAELVRLILARLETDRETARQALESAREAATHAESKAENKYDTRGLEAAYLADGQRRRLHEIELALAAFRNLPASFAEQASAIRVGALVQLAHDDGERWVFLGPDAAGLKVSLDDHDILVISPRSPLGQALLRRGEGDEVVLKVNGQVLCHEVLAVR